MLLQSDRSALDIESGALSSPVLSDGVAGDRRALGCTAQTPLEKEDSPSPPPRLSEDIQQITFLWGWP